MDGYQVAQRVRADPDNSAIVIVAVSGYGQEEHRARSTQAGCDHHLVKPIEPAVVSELLASLHSSAARRFAGKHRAPAQERRLATTRPARRRPARTPSRGGQSIVCTLSISFDK